MVHVLAKNHGEGHTGKPNAKIPASTRGSPFLMRGARELHEIRWHNGAILVETEESR
jgi:hypothetical protein